MFGAVCLFGVDLGEFLGRRGVPLRRGVGPLGCADRFLAVLLTGLLQLLRQLGAVGVRVA